MKRYLFRTVLAACLAAVTVVAGCVPAGLPTSTTDSGSTTTDARATACGDDVCALGPESPVTCPDDCHWCGDLVCGLNVDGQPEDWENCDVDCAFFCVVDDEIFACPPETQGCCLPETPGCAPACVDGCCP